MFKRKENQKHELEELGLYSRYKGDIALKCKKCNKTFVMDRIGGWAIEYSFKNNDKEEIIKAVEHRAKTSYTRQFIVNEQICEGLNFYTGNDEYDEVSAWRKKFRGWFKCK
ncbi:hypothetical protein ACFTXL_09890 [Bacillus subtilis]|uniref:hypothetical protein n=1 Tax=Bacillus TaxID=1386 RepID=UPI001CF9FD1F|nr:hypothetical protein [Bacillus subtilis]MCB4340539.1 hypothetical protein [Bacillus subtilis]MCL9628298.1 hypothetical protein [Bacillus subtilis]